MSFPTGLTTRHATLDDVHRVFDVVAAAEVVDIGEAMFDVADLQTDWASPRLDVAEDVLLVEDGERLVAWAQVYDSRAQADMHPEVRGRGIGAALVAWTEQRALGRAMPSADVRIGQTVIESLEGSRELFADRGYECIYDSWVLRLPAGAQLKQRPLPAGFSIRPFRSSEEHAVYSIIDDAFSEWEGRDPRPFEDWQAITTARPDFDPSLLLVAVQDEELIAACLGIHYPSEGWVDQIAVRPEHRGKGIATALLAAVFEQFRARGEDRLGVNTDSRTGALGLYERIGMELQLTFTHWSRLLRSSGR